MLTTRNPIEWSLSRVGLTRRDVPSGREALRGGGRTAPLVPRRIERRDLIEALRAGASDFGAARSDVFMLCVLYPLIGLLLLNLVGGYGVLHLLFPIAAGFALVGPFFAVGLNEMSRRREMGLAIGWQDAFEVARSPNFGAILLLGVVLFGIYLAWLFAADLIYSATFGATPPGSMGHFLTDVFGTAAGLTLIVVGCGVGFVFAAIVLVISVVSFPLLLDRDVGVETAVATSIRVARENPRTLATWGLFVAGLLILGSIPLFLGLAIVLPVLGHATWHLYRRIVPA